MNTDEVDLTLAIQLQAQFEEELRVQRQKDFEKQKDLQITKHTWNASWKNLPEPEQEKLTVALTDPCWELLDPNPNIHDLFLTFNHQFFWGRLNGIEVKWSPRMTLCAGVCSYEGRGGLCSVRLSTPLLKLRPRKDLVETLLHEMIHAYLFVTHNNTDHDGHGPQFHKHMYRINKLAGTNITVYHTFRDEVDLYRQHIWLCNGPCRKRPPYFGLVKRSMNRAPSPRDYWWIKHEESCGGSYTKIKEPEGYRSKRIKKESKEAATDIRTYFTTSGRSKKANTISENKNVTTFQTKTSNNSAVNSSNSSCNINGFGKTVSKTSKNAVHNSSNSSGNINGFGKTVSKSNDRNPNAKKGSNFGATAMGTSFGSKTIVVNKKINKSKTVVDASKVTSENPPNNANSHRGSFIAFSGSGFTLGESSGSCQSGESRLLKKFDKRKRENHATACVFPEKNVDPHPLKFESSTDFSESETLCPLCQVEIETNNFEEHLATCLGDWEIESDDEMESNTRGFDTSEDNRSRSLSSSAEMESNTRGFDTSENHSSRSLSSAADNFDIQNAGIGQTSEIDPIENGTRCSNTPTDNSRTIDLESTNNQDDSVIVLSEETRLYPCPVCPLEFSESEINAHVNSHFS